MKQRNMSIIVLSLLIALVLIVTGCSGKAENTAAVSEEPDALTTASIVESSSAFLAAAGSNGTWIIAVLQDITFDQEIVVEGEFIPKDEPYRKLALYTQDENRTVTDRFTLTAPRMTIRSENTRIQSGTFRGDILVEANGFHLVDATVEGNISFSSQEYLSSFSADENSTVTGETAVP